VPSAGSRVEHLRVPDPEKLIGIRIEERGHEDEGTGVGSARGVPVSLRDRDRPEAVLGVLGDGRDDQVGVRRLHDSKGR